MGHDHDPRGEGQTSPHPGVWQYQELLGVRTTQVLNAVYIMQNELLKKFRDQLKQEGILSKNTGVCLHTPGLCTLMSQA